MGATKMSSPDDIFANWRGLIDSDFSKTITQTFDLPDQDNYVYRAEAFAMTLRQIQEQIDSGKLKYKYQSHGQQIQVPSTDISAYTSIFSPSTSTPSALTAFLSNAKKSSPRQTVAQYLQSRRLCPDKYNKIPKSKTHINPYYDLWAFSCHETSFLGPLPDPSYAHPANAKHTHPILPVFYHHFGCVVPSYEALYIISQLVKESALQGGGGADAGAGGVIDMASGNGYWTYLLRRMQVPVTAVDSMASEYRTTWISDTIVVVGTMNENRFTGFEDCTVEEYFEGEMQGAGEGWELIVRVPVPSFAGKDEGMFVWKRKLKS